MYKGLEKLTETFNDMAQIEANLYQQSCLNAIDSISKSVATTFVDTVGTQYMNMLHNEKYILNDIARTLSDPIISNYTSHVGTIYTDVYSSALSEILNSAAEIARAIPDTSQILADALRNIDFSNLQISDDEVLEFEHKKLDSTDIETELLNCKEEIATINNADSVKSFFERHPMLKILLVLVLWETVIQPCLSTVAVDGVQKTWNENKYSICTTFFNEKQIGVVIADTAIIREDSNSQSKNLGCVLYGDEVVIIGSVPYWYKVNVLDSEGNVIEGYIANRNIDY